MTTLTAQETLHTMRLASGTFYTLAAQSQCHAYLEFTGILNEYIKICEENLATGIDFREENVHKGNSQMVIKDYQIDYMNEKLECIFQGLIRMQKAEKEKEPDTITLNEVILTNGKKLSCKEPLVLKIEKDDGLLIVDYYELGLYAYAPTRQELIAEITGEFQAIWKIYVLDDGSKLTPLAIQLRQRLLAFFTEEE